MKRKTPSTTLTRDIELIFEISCLRHLDRSWKRFFNPGFANNAEHIFRVTWTALIISAREKRGDHEKILKMALLHDIGESRTGDVDYIARQYTTRDDDRAMEHILEGTSLKTEFSLLWKEYEERTSIESQIVKDADTLDVEIDLREAQARGQEIGKLWDKERKERVYPTLYTASARKMWDEIHRQNPHDWHLNAPNRFTEGDWQKKHGKKS